MTDATPAPTKGNGPRFPSTLAPPAYYNGAPKMSHPLLASREESAHAAPVCCRYIATLLVLSGLEDRLRQTLLPVLTPYFTEAQSVPLRILEVASGTGSHSILFARTYGDHIELIQPTECDEYGTERINKSVAAAAAARESQDGQDRSLVADNKIKGAKRLDVMNSQDWEAVGTSGGPQGGYNLVFGSNFLHMIPLSVLAVFTPLSGYRTAVGEDHDEELMQEKKLVHIQPRRTAPDLFRLALAQARRFRHFDPPDPVRTVPTFHDRVLFSLGRKGEPHLSYDALVLRRLPLAWLTSAQRKNSLTTRSACALCPNRKLLIVLACARSTSFSASPRNAAGSSKRSTRSKRTATGSSCFNSAGRRALSSSLFASPAVYINT